MEADLTYGRLPTEIKNIANQALGLNVLQSLFNYGNKYHLIIKINHGKIIGFSLYHYEKTQLPNNSTYTTGIIDCICIATPHRKEGYGTLLTFTTLKKISAHNADRAEIMLKTPRAIDRDGDPGVPILGSEKLLNCIGFRRISIHPEYYKEKSILYNSECSFCNNHPCQCNGVLYAINNKDEQ